MGLNTRGIYHPKFTRSISRVDEGSMTSQIVISRRNPLFNGSSDDWDYDAGAPSGPSEYVDICRARARVTVASTWSAQGYMFGDETTVFQAVKFNIPQVEREWLLEGQPQEIRDEDRVVITETFFPALEPIKPFIYTVRNMLIDDTDAQWTLVTDANLKSRRSS